jgi:predicted Zn-dependent peptidase
MLNATVLIRMLLYKIYKIHFQYILYKYNNLGTLADNHIILLIIVMLPSTLFAKKGGYVDFIEYKLNNGLHIILYKDINEPNVVVGTKYHVGAKNEEADRTGFAHFGEHLFFHGTKNIPQGEFENIIMKAGGYCNAYINYDVTYYYQLLPAHEFKLGLWAESERMLHPIITQEGIGREREIVKEEKRMRYDNKPLGNAYYDMMGAMFTYETYGHNMIGSMDDLDAASLNDFQSFFKTYYVPNNACLVVAGNIDIEETKKWIEFYFSDIPRGKEIKRPKNFGGPSGKEKIVEKTEKGLDKTAVAFCYYAMPETSDDAYVMNVLAAILSGSKDYSYFENAVLVEKDTIINHVKATAELWEKVGVLRIIGKIEGENNEMHLQKKVEEQLERLKNEPVDKVLLQKVLNSFEAGYTDFYFHAESLADEITRYHHLWGNANEFNGVINKYLNITPEDIQRVANKYLNIDNRVTIIYHPEK